MPEKGTMTKQIVNTAGQIIYAATAMCGKGPGQWIVDREILKEPGVYYYIISTPYGKEVRKLVCVE